MISLNHAPRLVLGMASDAPAADATVAFAQASRRAKQSESAFDIRDLTAALAEVEGQAESGLRFQYAVPADPGCLLGDADYQDRDAQARDSLVAAMDYLWQWKWQEAGEAAKSVLMETNREDLRDEALNVLAAAEAMSGNFDKAESALRQAVEGEWNFALQQNLGIIAMTTDPALATSQSSYWLDAAETADDRESAIFFVLKMWSDHRAEDEEVPEEILGSFRSALGSQLSEETFAFLGTFLAQRDSEWTSKPSNWATSPHATSLTAELVMARAEGLETFVEFLIEQADATHPEIVRERDRLINGLVEAMFDEDPAIGAASMGLGLVDGGVPCNSLNTALLRMLTVREICMYFNENDGEPKVEFLDYLIEVHAYTKTLEDPDLKEYLEDVLSNSASMFAFGYVRGRYKELDHFDEPLSMILAMSQRWGSRRRLNKPEARGIAAEIQSWATEVRAVVHKIQTLPINEDVSKFVVELNGMQQQANRMASEILGKL